MCQWHIVVRWVFSKELLAGLLLMTAQVSGFGVLCIARAAVNAIFRKVVGSKHCRGKDDMHKRDALPKHGAQFCCSIAAGPHLRGLQS